MKNKGFSKSLKALSIFLSFLIIVYVVPASIWASALDNFFEKNDIENINQYGIIELIERREENVKHFRLDNGTIMAVQYQEAIHHLDSEEKWQDIDNTLIKTGSLYSTQNKKISFATRSNAQSLFTLQEKDYKIEISPATSLGNEVIKKVSGKANNNVTSLSKSATEIEKITTLDKLSSSIKYPNIFEGVDIEYVVLSNNIKENIIVKEKKENYNYNFSMIFTGLIAEMNPKNGEIIISDKLTKEIKYLIPAGYMFDANGEQSDAVSYVLKDNGEDIYTLTVSADNSWINDNSRAFPVTIDPPIYTPTGAVITDTYINSASPTSTPYTLSHLYAGSTATAYWKTSLLPTLPASAYISNAEISMKYITTTGSAASYIGVYKVTSDWEETFTYNQYNAGTAGQRVSEITDFNLIDLSTSLYTWNITDIARDWYNGEANYGVAFGRIIGYTASGNIQFHSNNSVSASRPSMCIYYKDMKGIEDYWSHSSQSAGLAGTGHVNNATGTLAFTIGTLSTTDRLFGFTPTLVYNQALAGQYNKTESAEVPYRVAMLGYGFKFNMNESIVKRTYTRIDNTAVTYYVWSDSDGTEHYFLPDGNSTTIYKDEDGLMLTLEVKASSYTITDSNHNVRTFTRKDTGDSSINAGGILASIKDSNGNLLQFDYNTYGRITYVKVVPYNSTAITYLRITHNSYGQVNRILNETTQQAVVMYYSSTYNGASISPYNGGYLRKIVYAHQENSTSLDNWANFMETGSNAYIIADATASYEYDNGGKLISAKDELSDYRIEYTYTGEKVTSVKEYAGVTTAGQEIGISYYNGYTEIRTSGSDDIYGNSDDLLNIYVFDGEGRVITTYSTDLSRTFIYGAANGKYVGEENANAKNNIKESAFVGGSATNHIFNGGFEIASGTSPVGWTKSTNVSLLSASDVYLGAGNRNIYFNVKANTTDYIYQYVHLKEGKYTLSMNIFTHLDTNVRVFLKAESISDNTRAFIEELPVNEYNATGGWAFATTHFDAGNYVDNGENFKISVEVVGGSNLNNYPSISIDCLMLEQNIGNSQYSAIEFGNFENYAINSSGNNVYIPSNYWINNDGSTVSIVNTGALFGNSLRINGNISSRKYAKQTVHTASPYDISAYDYGEYYGSSAKTFLVSGFAMGTHQAYSANSKFSLVAEVKYYKGQGKALEVVTEEFDFVSSSFGWQFASGSFSTEEYKLIYEINILCEYSHQPGTAYFDNVSLVECTDDSANKYAYNDEGLLWVHQSGYNTTIYEYDIV